MFRSIEKAYRDFKTMTIEDVGAKVESGELTSDEYLEITGVEYQGDTPIQAVVDAYHQTVTPTPSAEMQAINALGLVVAQMQAKEATSNA